MTQNTGFFISLSSYNPQPFLSCPENKMTRDKIYNASWRTRKAYRVTAVVMGSYIRLFLLKKIFGKKYYEKRIAGLHLKNARRIKRAILELNGLFIKIGQLLSILSNFLPDEFQKPLEELQDKIPPRPFHEVEKRLRSELGDSPAALFQSIEKTPHASASIGQVHRAVLPDGTTVAVKVQHYSIEEIARVDLKIIHKINKIIGWFFHIRGLDYVHSQIRKMILEELDFRQEAHSMLVISQNLQTEERLVVPRVHPFYSTGRVLTTTWYDGVKIADTDQLDRWGINKADIVERLLRAWCKMVLKDGFYHADPHPGNILIQPDGTIVLLDFGAVAHLGPNLREGIPVLIEAAIKNDNATVIETMRQMGFLTDGPQAGEMAERMINALRNFLQNEVKLNGLDFKNIEVDPFNNSLFSLIRDIGLSDITGAVQVPKDFVLLNRTLTLLLGISNNLAPQLNPLQVVRPFVKEYISTNGQDLVGLLRSFLHRSLSTAIGLPDKLHRAIHIIEKGQLISRTPDIKEGARLLYQVGQQFVFAILIIAACIFGYLFLQNDQHDLAKYAAAAAAVFFLFLLRSIRKGNRINRRIGY